MNPTMEKFRAASHFGLGSSAMDLLSMGDDPRGWLQDQVRQPQADPGPPTAPSSKVIAARTKAATERRALQNEAQGDPDKVASVEAMQQDFRREVRAAIVDETAARFTYGIETPSPFRERLVQFWSNHFTVSRQGRPQIVGACLAYENEAIRRNLDGLFSQMLTAVVSHPVMLYYLDNVQSTGPDSPVGRRRRLGLNENLAREVLELHTLGVDGGYDQDDVKALAAMLTGWTVGNARLSRFGAVSGEFVFVAPMHQPGSFKLLGRRYAEDGLEQARTALQDLAHHPATARFLATKLARHFVSDEPPAAAVDMLADAYLESGGYLPAVHEALTAVDAAWDMEIHRKLKTPYEYLLSTHRGLGLPGGRAETTLAPLRIMNQLPFSAPSPAGWPDDQDHWGSPAALKQRVEWAVAFGQRAVNRVSVQDALTLLIPPVDNEQQLRSSISRAESAAQALGLLLAAPSSQWR